MTLFIEPYRDFDPKLWVYMARAFDANSKLDSMPTMNLREVSKEDQNKYVNPKKHAYFNTQKEQAAKIIAKINLDDNSTVDTQKERDLRNQLLNNNDTEFKRLEEQYRVSLRKLGSTTKAMKERYQLLQNALGQYIQKLQGKVEKLNIQHGNVEALGALVDKVIRKKLPAGAQALGGLGKYIVQANLKYFKGGLIQKGVDSREAILKLISQPGVLSGAIAQMILKLPRVANQIGEVDYFQSQLNKNSALTQTFGDSGEAKSRAAKALALRFHVVFKNDDKTPVYMVDVTNNKVYRPGKDWDTALLKVCRSFKDLPDMEKSDQKMAKIKNEQLKKWQALTAGMHGGRKVDGIQGLSHNAHLVALLKEVKKYDVDLNAPLRLATIKFKKLSSRPKMNPKVGTALDQFSAQLTPDLIRSSDTHSQIGSLFRMIKDLLNSGKKPEEIVARLKKITNDLKEGKDVTEVYRKRSAYELVLNKKPRPSALTLIRLEADAKFRTAYFKKEGAKIKHVNTDFYTDKNYEKYGKSLVYKRIDAYAAWLKGKLKLSANPELTWSPEQKGISANLTLNGKSYHLLIKQTKDGLVLHDDTSMKPMLKTSRRNLLAALQGAVHKIDAIQRMEKQNDTYYIAALKSRVSKKYSKNQTFIESLMAMYKPGKSSFVMGAIPIWNEKAAKASGDMDQYQQKHDQACLAFIEKNMDVFRPYIKEMMRQDADFAIDVASAKVPTKTYQQALTTLIPKGYVSGLSDLGQILAMNPAVAKQFKRPKWNSANKNASQIALDQARLNFIVTHLKYYRNNIYKDAMRYPKNAYAQTILKNNQKSKRSRRA